jgi:hypothetical protein
MKDMLADGGTALDARHGAVRRRITVLGTVTAMIAVLGTVTGLHFSTAGAASLDSPRCQFQGGHHNVCIHIAEGVRSQFKVLGDVRSQFKVAVGLDLNMSQADAQKIIDAPDDHKFRSTLFGADFPHDTNLGPIFLDVLVPPETSASGLSLDFRAVNMSRDKLDEDLLGNHEIFAVVFVVVPSLGIDLRFRTPEVSHGI